MEVIKICSAKSAYIAMDSHSFLMLLSAITFRAKKVWMQCFSYCCSYGDAKKLDILQLRYLLIQISLILDEAIFSHSYFHISKQFTSMSCFTREFTCRRTENFHICKDNTNNQQPKSNKQSVGNDTKSTYLWGARKKICKMSNKAGRYKEVRFIRWNHVLKDCD